MKNAFHWRAEPKASTVKPQWAYYWRKKAGLTGTRQDPKRHWRQDDLRNLQSKDQAKRE
jgi:hypothetical protein